MMKATTLLCALLWVSPAFADNPKGEVNGTEEQVSGKAASKESGKDGDKEDAGEHGKFTLLGLKCEAEDENTLETTPGSPPLDVDDPATPGCNGWEVNIVTSGELGKTMSWETPLFDINYGIGDNIQLKFEVPYEIIQIDGSSKPGVGRSEFGIKYRFYDDESSERSLAVYPQVEFATPGVTAVDTDDGGTLAKLPLLFATRLGETSKGAIMITANLGYNMSTQAASESYVSASVGIGFPLTTKIAVMFEGSTEQAASKNTDDVREGYFKANVGLLGRINSHLLWFGSIGQTFASSDDDDTSHTCMSLGVRVLAGGP